MATPTLPVLERKSEQARNELQRTMKQTHLRERIAERIFFIRGQKVLLDADLAKLYGVTTFNFNKAVRRNIDRFPEDFMFRLTAEEVSALRFQFGMSKSEGRGEEDIMPLSHGVRHNTRFC